MSTVLPNRELRNRALAPATLLHPAAMTHTISTLEKRKLIRLQPLTAEHSPESQRAGSVAS